MRSATALLCVVCVTCFVAGAAWAVHASDVVSKGFIDQARMQSVLDTSEKADNAGEKSQRGPALAQIVPEAGSIVLLAVGGAALIAGRFRMWPRG